MKIDRRVVLGLLLIGLIFSAGFLLRDFLLANLVKPMALLLWMGSRLIASIDQLTYWAGLILALLLISLPRLLRRQPGPEESRAGNATGTLYSIRHWRTLILLNTNEADRLNYLKNSLRTLLNDLYASRESSQVSLNTHDDIAQGDTRLPDSIREFLLLSPPSEAMTTQAQPWQRLSRAPARFFRRRTKQDQAKYYQSIEEVISFMEKQLENEDEQ